MHREWHRPCDVDDARAAACAAVAAPCARACRPVPGFEHVHLHGPVAVHVLARRSSSLADVLTFSRQASVAGVDAPLLAAHGTTAAGVSWFVDTTVDVDAAATADLAFVAPLLAAALHRLHRAGTTSGVAGLEHPDVRTRTTSWMVQHRPALELRVRAMVAEAAADGPAVALHADCAPGHNVLVDRDGRLWLIDPHPARRGPAEYDLAYADAIGLRGARPSLVSEHYTGAVDGDRYRQLLQALLLRTWLSARVADAADDCRRLERHMRPATRAALRT